MVISDTNVPTLYNLKDALHENFLHPPKNSPRTHRSLVMSTTANFTLFLDICLPDKPSFFDFLCFLIHFCYSKKLISLFSVSVDFTIMYVSRLPLISLILHNKLIPRYFSLSSASPSPCTMVLCVPSSSPLNLA